jgi:hypothetical protein
MVVLKRVFAKYNTREKNGSKPMLFFFKFDPTHQEMALLPFPWFRDQGIKVSMRHLKGNDACVEKGGKFIFHAVLPLGARVVQ